ncbi:MAG: hypothetical protein QNJ84_02090 [Alphaproteobacteria bacterium]|nr:hypothetical protein [Alphaproteobacteria bacterium]
MNEDTQPSLFDVLTPDNARRCGRVLDKLADHLDRFVLVGGLAQRCYLSTMEKAPKQGGLNDIDFAIEHAALLPSALKDEFLVNHFHPNATPGQIILQLIDEDDAVRIDIFRANRGAASRSVPHLFFGHRVKVLSLQDAAAKVTALLLALEKNEQTPRKFAEQLLRIMAVVDPEDVARVWPIYRKADHPEKFSDAAGRVERLLASHRGFLRVPVLNEDPDHECRRCVSDGQFSLADRKRVFAVMGYV